MLRLPPANCVTVNSLKKNKKTKHHCHLSGLYIGPYCNTCNLKLKYKKVPTLIRLPKRRRKRYKENKQNSSTGHVKNSSKKAENVARDNEDLDTADYMMTEESYMIPGIFHHLKRYDSHLIMQYVTHQYAPNSIDVITTTSEKCLSFQIDNLRFLDSLQFLTASLDTLVQSLAADGRDNFSHTARHYPDSDLVFAKGNYLYEYMDGRDKFLLTELPPIDAFYS